MIANFSIQFDELSHAYLLDGAPAPSVTQVLAAEGLSGCAWWTEQARKRGTAVHTIALLVAHSAGRGRSIDEIISLSRWEPSRTAPVLIGYGRAVAKYYLESGFTPEVVEEPVGSKRFGICGKLDVWGKMPNGRTRLVDFKSGEPQAAAWVQTALYAMCLEETYGIKTDERTVVWLRQDGGYKTWDPRPAGGIDLAVGQSAINVYRWRVANGMIKE